VKENVLSTGSLLWKQCEKNLKEEHAYAEDIALKRWTDISKVPRQWATIRAR
jgi:hypothetical protein